MLWFMVFSMSSTLVWWEVGNLHSMMLGSELVVKRGNHTNATDDDEHPRGALDASLVAFNIGLGIFDLFDVGINWSWLEELSIWSNSDWSLSWNGLVNEYRHVTLHLQI